jgi:hypothetical protein
MLFLVCSTLIGRLTGQEAIAQPGNGAEECYVVFCESDTRKCLVFDSSGNWIRQVRVMHLAMEYPNKAYVALQQWEGVYRPTKPGTKSLYVGKITSISAAEFQKMIDDLNNGGAGPAIPKANGAPADNTNSRAPVREPASKTEGIVATPPKPVDMNQVVMYTRDAEQDLLTYGQYQFSQLNVFTKKARPTDFPSRLRAQYNEAVGKALIDYHKSKKSGRPDATKYYDTVKRYNEIYHTKLEEYNERVESQGQIASK